METLIIGSTVCDVVVNIDHLPKVGEDILIQQQQFNIGGCGFNVAWIFHLLELPYTLFSPIGKGIYGDFINNYFKQHHLAVHLESDDYNGCCYSLVNKEGERTFICEHGTEYFYKQEWFDRLDGSKFQQVYICRLEIEEKTGDTIIDWLEKNTHLQLFFAPGPRIHFIDDIKLNRIFALQPILHLNETEALSYTNTTSLEEASRLLRKRTHNTVIITLGSKGAYYNNGSSHYVAGIKDVVVKDTIGAGDSHIGSIMAFLSKHDDLNTAIEKANRIAAKVVSQTGL